MKHGGNVSICYINSQQIKKNSPSGIFALILGTSKKVDIVHLIVFLYYP